MDTSYDYYRIFYQVAATKSFTKAASILHNSQPNITRAIKNLEQALNCPLFFRTSRSVQLTPEGEQLYSFVAPAIQQIQAGEASVLLRSKLQGGTLSIGVSEIALHMVLLPVLEAFHREYPLIHLRIFNSNSQQAASALKNHLVDLSLVTPPIENPDAFHQTPLASFQEVPVCGPAFPYSSEQILTWEDLVSAPIISLCTGTSTHQLYEDWFRQHGLTFSPDIETATADQILPMVRANLGIGFVPEHAAQKAAEDGSVKILRLQEAPPERSVILLKRKDSSLSIAAAELERVLHLTNSTNCV